MQFQVINITNLMKYIYNIKHYFRLSICNNYFSETMITQTYVQTAFLCVDTKNIV